MRRGIYQRLRKLQAAQPGGGVIVLSVPADKTNDEVIAARFGPEGPPAHALLVMLQRFASP